MIKLFKYTWLAPAVLALAAGNCGQFVEYEKPEIPDVLRIPPTDEKFGAMIATIGVLNHFTRVALDYTIEVEAESMFFENEDPWVTTEELEEAGLEHAGEAELYQGGEVEVGILESPHHSIGSRKVEAHFSVDENWYAPHVTPCLPNPQKGGKIECRWENYGKPGVCSKLSEDGGLIENIEACDTAGGEWTALPPAYIKSIEENGRHAAVSSFSEFESQGVCVDGSDEEVLNGEGKPIHDSGECVYTDMGANPPDYSPTGNNWIEFTGKCDDDLYFSRNICEDNGAIWERGTGQCFNNTTDADHSNYGLTYNEEKCKDSTLHPNHEWVVKVPMDLYGSPDPEKDHPGYPIYSAIYKGKFESCVQLQKGGEFKCYAIGFEDFFFQSAFLDIFDEEKKEYIDVFSYIYDGVVSIDGQDYEIKENITETVEIPELDVQANENP